MTTVVRKYGGTSVADVARLRHVAGAVASVQAAGHAVVVVVSAQGDRTDNLLREAAALGAGSGRETDQLLATGEGASAALLAMALTAIGVPAVSLTAAQAGIVATGPHGAGLIADVDPAPIRRHLAAGRVAVVAGFQGVNADGDVVTLGRGGSDTTAVALATALGTGRCEIYTDVTGVYTADPRAVPDARCLPVLPAAVMVELAFAGARVLHSRATELAATRHVELRIASSLTHEAGTTVLTEGYETMLENYDVLAVTHDADVVRVLIQSSGPRRDLAAQLLAVLSEHNAPLDLVARSGPYEDEFRMGFTMRGDDLARVEPALRAAVAEVGGTIRLDADVAKISIVGVGLLSRPEYTCRMLNALAAAGIPTSWLATSQLRSSVTVPLGRAAQSVALLHDEFGLHREPVAAGGAMANA